MISIDDFKEKQIIFLKTKEGQKISFKNDNVIISNSEGIILHQSTCYRLFAIFIVGEITLTSTIIDKAKKFGFSIVFLSVTFRLNYVISVTGEGNTILRKKQYLYNGIEYAKEIAKNKIKNQRYMISRIRNKTEDLIEDINKIDNYYNDIDAKNDIQSLMGIEGNVSRIYFKLLFKDINWLSRKPRIKNDMINASLDIGYTILFSFIDALINIFGFDTYYGVYHRCFYMRKSLVCDLMEPFRCIIDNVVKNNINLKKFKRDDFDIIKGKWILKRENSAKYCSSFIECIVNNKECMFTYIKNYYRDFMKGNTKIRYWLVEDSGIS